MLDLPEHQPADLKNEPVTPTWLVTDPCPPWCAGDHPANEHPEDRAHISPLLDVPVIVKDEFRGG